MKVTEVHVFQHDLPVVDPPYTMATQSVYSLDSTIVMVVCDDGTVGYGETCPLGSTYQPQHALGARAAIAEVAPSLLGLDPTLHGQVNAAMDGALLGHGYAKAALDAACWDLAGKAHGVRVCDLLGGATRERLPAYHVVGLGDADRSAETATRLQDEGYTRLQVKVGGRSVEEDIAATRAVDAVRRPGVRLVVDANRGWRVPEAIRFSQACRDVALTIEQPCNSYAELRALVGKLCHPMFVDESATDLQAVTAAIEDGVADGFGLKVSRVGGLTAMQAIRDVCAAHRRPHTLEDTWGGDIVWATTVHMAATVEPAQLDCTWLSQTYVDGFYDDRAPVRIPDGWIDVPSGPGLGVEPDATRWGDPVTSFTS